MNDKKICFITSVFAKDYNEADKPSYFPKCSNYDYYLFTNLCESVFNTSWEVKKIEDNEFSRMDITSNIIKSRYPKFMGWYILENILKKNYDVVIYCDALYYPKSDENWNAIVELIKEGGIVQYKHGRDSYEELRRVMKYTKDTKERCDTTANYLRDNKFPDKYLMTENTMIGYDPNNEFIREVFTDFWNIYKTYKLSHRDQPLWSFVQWKNNMKPVLYKTFRKKFVKKAQKGFNNHTYV